MAASCSATVCHCSARSSWASYDDYASYVYFLNGSVSSYRTDINVHVRLVRGSQ